MDQQSVILLHDSCRLCLQQQGKHNVFRIHNLSKDIYTWMSVKIKPDDGLPQNICEQCFETVNSIRVLRELALCNESRLRGFMLNDDTEEIIRNSDDREQQMEDHNQFMNLEINEDEIKLEEDDYIQINDNYLSINDTAQVQLPASNRLAVRKDLFSSNMGANEPLSSRVKSDYTVHTSEQGHIRAEIDQVHKCTICHKVYESKKKWYHHQRSHNKPFSCPVPLCNKKFANRGDVEKHVRVHTGEKPYECEICFKKFTQRCSLKMHKENLHVNKET